MLMRKLKELQQSFFEERNKADKRTKTIQVVHKDLK